MNYYDLADKAIENAIKRLIIDNEYVDPFLIAKNLENEFSNVRSMDRFKKTLRRHKIIKSTLITYFNGTTFCTYHDAMDCVLKQVNGAFRCNITDIRDLSMGAIHKTVEMLDRFGDIEPNNLAVITVDVVLEEAYQFHMQKRNENPAYQQNNHHLLTVEFNAHLRQKYGSTNGLLYLDYATCMFNLGVNRREKFAVSNVQKKYLRNLEKSMMNSLYHLEDTALELMGSKLTFMKEYFLAANIDIVGVYRTLDSLISSRERQLCVGVEEEVDRKYISLVAAVECVLPYSSVYDPTRFLLDNYLGTSNLISLSAKSKCLSGGATAPFVAYQNAALEEHATLLSTAIVGLALLLSHEYKQKHASGDGDLRDDLESLLSEDLVANLPLKIVLHLKELLFEPKSVLADLIRCGVASVHANLSAVLENVKGKIMTRRTIRLIDTHTVQKRSKVSDDTINTTSTHVEGRTSDGKAVSEAPVTSDMVFGAAADTASTHDFPAVSSAASSAISASSSDCPNPLDQSSEQAEEELQPKMPKKMKGKTKKKEKKSKKKAKKSNDENLFDGETGVEVVDEVVEEVDEVVEEVENAKEILEIADELAAIELDKEEEPHYTEDTLLGCEISLYVTRSCACVLFCRLMKMEIECSPRKGTPLQTKVVADITSYNTADALNASASLNSEASLESQLSKSTVSYLQVMLQSVLEDLTVPAFECLRFEEVDDARAGCSFLKFLLYAQQTDILVPHFSKFFKEHQTSFAGPDTNEEAIGHVSTCLDPNVYQEFVRNFVDKVFLSTESLVRDVQDSVRGRMDMVSFLWKLEETVLESVDVGRPSFELYCGKSFMHLMYAHLSCEEDLSAEHDSSSTLMDQWVMLHSPVTNPLTSEGLANKTDGGFSLKRSKSAGSQCEEVIEMSACSLHFVSVDVIECVLIRYFETQQITFNHFASSSELFQYIEKLLLNTSVVLGTLHNRTVRGGEGEINKLVLELKQRSKLTAYYNNDLQCRVAVDHILGSADMLIFHNIDDAVTLEKATTTGTNQHADLFTLAVRLVSRVPLGCPCIELCLWDELFSCHLEAGDRVGISLVNFIMVARADLQKARPDVKYYCFDICAGDCIPISTILPTVKEVKEALADEEFALLGSWCVSAACGVTNTKEFQGNVWIPVLSRQKEEQGVHGYRNIMSSTLHIIFTLPVVLQLTVLKLCFNSIAFIYEVDVLSVQQDVIEALQSGELFPKKDECARALKRLVSIAFLCDDGDKEVSRIRQNIPRLLDHAFQVSDLKTVEDMPVTIAEYNITPAGDPLSNSSSTSTVVQHSVIPEGAVDPKSDIEDLLRTSFNKTVDSAASVENTQRALKILSKDLYSSDVHFVMELIQNADDNFYGEGVVPTLDVELLGSALVVYNNEVGFASKNMRALCCVGNSTKTGKAGYIGQKGIGFKSVFSKSHCPEIHSNGYHFKFNREYMIEPIWIDEHSSDGKHQWPAHVKASNGESEHFNTIIRLNLDDIAQENFAKLNASLEESFDPKLLLFLNKIKKMHLHHKVRHYSTKIAKTILAGNELFTWTQIHSEYVNHPLHNEKPFDDTIWFIRRWQFEPAEKRNADEEKREQTEVAVAFRFKISQIHLSNVADTIHVVNNIDEDIDGDVEVDLSTQSFELQLDDNQLLPIYAFLPTKTPMFKFIMQADFVLSSSRESLHEEDPWNLYLIEHVATLFVDAIVEMFDHMWLANFGPTGCSDMAKPAAFFNQLNADVYSVQLKVEDILALLPRRSASPIVDFFVNKVYDALKLRPIFRSRSGKKLVPSTEAFTVHHLTDFSPRDFVSEELLYTSCGRVFLDDSIKLDDELASLLGVTRFSANEALSCIDLVVRQYQDVDVQYNYAEMSKLLFLMSKFFDRSGSGTDSRASSSYACSMDGSVVLTKLRKLPIWPLTNGEVVSLSQKTILVQCQKGSFNEAQGRCLNVFKTMMPMLDEKLMGFAKGIKIANSNSGGDEIISAFLLKDLRPSSMGAGKALSRGGGFTEMTPGTVVKNFIVSCYSRGSEEGNPTIDRSHAAAFLAFIFHYYYAGGRKADLGDLSKSFGDCGILLPTFRMASDGESWKYAKVMYVSLKDRCMVNSNSCNAVEEEVHFGLEIKESFALEENKNFKLIFKDLSYHILDPLCAAYAFGKLGVVDKYGHADLNLKSKAIKDVYTETAAVSVDRLSVQWKEFLYSMGVNNLVAVRRREMSENSFDAPSLIQSICYIIDLKKQRRRFANITATPEELEAAAKAIELTESLALPDSGVDYCANLPLFLPHPSDGALSVYPDAYKSMEGFVKTIIRDLQYISTINKTNAKTPDFCFMNILNKMPFFPAYVHDTFSTMNLKILTSPRNIFFPTKRLDDVQVSTALGPHAIYIPKDFYEGASLRGFEFIPVEVDTKNLTATYDPNMLLDLFGWLIYSQNNSCFESTIPVMTNLYRELLQAMEDVNMRSKVERILAGRCIWVPTRLLSSRLQDSKNKEREKGYFLPIEQVVKEDDACTHFSDSEGSSAVKVLKQYYGSDELVPLLARAQCCVVCQVVEGLRGVRGGPLKPFNTYRTFGVDECDEDVLCCTCEDSGFGKFLPSGGLVKSTPSVHDLLQLLQYSINYSKTEKTKNLLVDLSMDIWRCFHLPRTIIPFSPTALKDLKTFFNANSVLLTMTGGYAQLCNEVSLDMETGVSDKSALSGSKQCVIAVDSKTLWEMFGGELSKYSVCAPKEIEEVEEGEICGHLKNDGAGGGVVESTPEPFNKQMYHWVDAITEKGCDNSVDVWHSELDGEHIHYNVVQLEKDVSSLLKLPPEEFQACTEIPFKSVFAPRNMNCLLKYLCVPFLTDIVQEQWACKAAPPSRQGNTILINTINVLLEASQTYLHHHNTDVLEHISTSQSLSELMSMSVVDCVSIDRTATLTLGDIPKLTKSIDCSYRIHRQDRSNCMYVDGARISPSEIETLAEDLVMLTIRTTIAQLGKHQYDEYDELLGEIQKHLSLFKKISDAKDFELMLTNAAKLSRLPEDVSVWKLQSQVSSSAMSGGSEPAHKPSVEGITEAARASALAGFDKMAAIDLANEQRRKQKRKDAIDQVDNETEAQLSAHPDMPPQAEALSEIDSDRFEQWGASFSTTGGGCGSSSSVGVWKPGYVSMGGDHSSLDVTALPSNEALDKLQDQEFESLLAEVNASAIDVNQGANVNVTVEALRSSGFTKSGKFGELLAREYLDTCGTVDGLTVKKVTWVNRNEEQGLPYDLEVVFSEEGGVEVTKYCEVKTRFVAAPDVCDSWFISPSEVSAALSRGHEYFACVICLGLSSTAGAVRIATHSLKLVGLQRGLCGAVKSNDAQLILHVPI